MSLEIVHTCIVQAFTSSAPTVKKYIKDKALYPVVMILLKALKRQGQVMCTNNLV